MVKVEEAIWAVNIIASRLKAENEQRQVSTLLYRMREEAEPVLSSTNITEADREN